MIKREITYSNPANNPKVNERFYLFIIKTNRGTKTWTGGKNKDEALRKARKIFPTEELEVVEQTGPYRPIIHY